MRVFAYIVAFFLLGLTAMPVATAEPETCPGDFNKSVPCQLAPEASYTPADPAPKCINGDYCLTEDGTYDKVPSKDTIPNMQIPKGHVPLDICGNPVGTLNSTEKECPPELFPPSVEGPRFDPNTPVGAPIFEKIWISDPDAVLVDNDQPSVILGVFKVVFVVFVLIILAGATMRLVKGARGKQALSDEPEQHAPAESEEILESTERPFN